MMTHIKTAEERMHPMCLDDKSVWCNAYFDEVQELRAALEQAQKKIEKLEIDNHGLIESKKSQYNLFMLNLKESNDRLNEACSDNNKKLELICKLKYEIDGMTDEAQLFKDRIAELEAQAPAQPIEPAQEFIQIALQTLYDFQEATGCDVAGDLKPHQLKSAQPEQEPVALKVYQGEICYLSKDDDQSYGMWCPVAYDSNHGFKEGTIFYIKPATVDRHTQGE